MNAPRNAPTPDVLVVGAGIIGAACAWRLAQAGAHVTLLERAAPAAGASQAALGVLQFHVKPGTHPAYQHLSLRSRDLYPAWLAELEGRPTILELADDFAMEMTQGAALHGPAGSSAAWLARYPRGA